MATLTESEYVNFDQQEDLEPLIDFEDSDFVCRNIFSALNESNSGKLDFDDILKLENWLSYQFEDSHKFMNEDTPFSEFLLAELDYDKNGMITRQDIHQFLVQRFCGRLPITKEPSIIKPMEEKPDLPEFNVYGVAGLVRTLEDANNEKAEFSQTVKDEVESTLEALGHKSTNETENESESDIDYGDSCQESSSDHDHLSITSEYLKKQQNQIYDSAPDRYSETPYERGQSPRDFNGTQSARYSVDKPLFGGRFESQNKYYQRDLNFTQGLEGADFTGTGGSGYRSEGKGRVMRKTTDAFGGRMGKESSVSPLEKTPFEDKKTFTTVGKTRDAFKRKNFNQTSPEMFKKDHLELDPKSGKTGSTCMSSSKKAPLNLRSNQTSDAKINPLVINPMSEPTKEQIYGENLFRAYDRHKNGYVRLKDMEKIVTDSFTRIGVQFTPTKEDILSYMGNVEDDPNLRVFQGEFVRCIMNSLRARNIRFV